MIKKVWTYNQCADYLISEGKEYPVPGMAMRPDGTYFVDTSQSFRIVAAPIKERLSVTPHDNEKHLTLDGERGDYLVFNPLKKIFFVLPHEQFQRVFLSEKDSILTAIRDEKFLK